MENLSVVVNQEPGSIVISNFEDIKSSLEAQMEVYNNLEVTDENLQERKKDVATLRKMATAVDTRRKEVKAACMVPYESVEAKFTELKELINAPIDTINTQVKEYEKKKLEEKKQLISDIYDANIEDMREYLPLEKIYDKKWENAATSKKHITESIQEVVKSTQMAVSTIEGFTSDAKPKALTYYRNSLDLNGAITMINKYEADRAEILRKEQERKEREEAERKQREEREAERRRIAEQQKIEREAREKAEEKKRQEAINAQFKSAAEPEVKPFTVEDKDSKPFTADDLDKSFTVEASKKHDRCLALFNVSDADYQTVIALLDSLGINYQED